MEPQEPQFQRYQMNPEHNIGKFNQKMPQDFMYGFTPSQVNPNYDIQNLIPPQNPQENKFFPSQVLVNPNQQQNGGSFERNNTNNSGQGPNIIKNLNDIACFNSPNSSEDEDEGEQEIRQFNQNNQRETNGNTQGKKQKKKQDRKQAQKQENTTNQGDQQGIQQQNQQYQNVLSQQQQIATQNNNQNYNTLNFSNHFSNNNSKPGNNIFGNQIIQSNGINNSFNNLSFQNTLMNNNELGNSFYQYGSMFPPTQSQFQQQQGDQLFMLESSNVQKKQQPFLPYNPNLSKTPLNNPNNNQNNLNISKLSAGEYDQNQQNLQSSIYDPNLQNMSSNNNNNNSIAPLQNNIIGNNNNQYQQNTWNNLNQNGQLSKDDKKNTNLSMKKPEDSHIQNDSQNTQQTTQKSETKKPKGKGKKKQKQQQQIQQSYQSQQSLESQHLQQNISNSGQNLQSQYEKEWEELKVENEKYKEIMNHIMGKQHIMKEEHQKIANIYNHLQYLNIDLQKYQLDFKGQKDNVNKKSREVVQLHKKISDMSGLSNSKKQEMYNNLHEQIQMTQSIENTLVNNRFQNPQLDDNQRLFQQSINTFNNFLNTIQQQQQDHHKMINQIIMNPMSQQQQGYGGQTLTGPIQQYPYMNNNNGPLDFDHVKQEDTQIMNNYHLHQKPINTQEQPITIEAFEQSLKQHIQPKRQYNKKSKSQPNTKHVAVNMMNNLLRHIDDIYSQKVPCRCLQINESYKQKNGNLNNNNEENNEQNSDQNMVLKCRRCQDLAILSDYHKLKTVNLESFRKMWENYRIRVISENYFLYRGSSHILGKNYVANNKEALHSCLKGYFIGVRDFKHFYKQL